MRLIRVLLVGAFVFTGLVSAVSPAAAIRLSCSELLDLRAGGWSDDEIVKTYGTTRARLNACERLSQQEERFEAERTRFFQVRAERGLSN
jgi:hypothetical protein